MKLIDDDGRCILDLRLLDLHPGDVVELIVRAEGLRVEVRRQQMDSHSRRPASQILEGETPLSYRPEQAARVLNTSRDTIFKLLNSGELKSMKIGAARFIPAAELNAFLARKLAEGIEAEP